MNVKQQLWFITKNTLIAFVVSSLISYLLFLINPIEYNGFSSQNIWIEIFVAFIFAPFIETVIFFLLTYKAVYFFTFIRNKKIFYILFSSITFGISHAYNINYVLETTITGLFMANLFYTLEKKGKSGFLGTILMHSLYNILTFIINLILK